MSFFSLSFLFDTKNIMKLFLFFQKKIMPSVGELFQLEAEEDDGLELPTKQNDEFRPFIRRLPEFKFWYSATKATVIAFGCTFFELFNIPVFWPILVMYFITLFCITMKRQIKVSCPITAQERTRGEKFQSCVPTVQF